MSDSVIARWLHVLRTHPLATPIMLVWSVWLAGMVTTDAWSLIEQGWPMALTMAAGSFIAGATSEGGGAVAFPVMTLLFELEPSVARDFSLLIQSIGMTAASYAIWRLEIPVERVAILWGTLGGAAGLCFAIFVIAPHVQPAFVKMFFVSFWAGFGYALHRIHRRKGRETRREIGTPCLSTIAQIFGAGVLGGAVSGLTGSGLDISLFAILVLGFGIDERVATPTSVVLMTGNAIVGSVLRFSMGEVSAQAIDFWVVCVPVVVVGAPVGAWLSAKLPRAAIVRFLQGVIALQLVGAWVLLPFSWGLMGFSVGTLVLGSLGFHVLGRMGHRRLRRSGTRWRVAPPALVSLVSETGLEEKAEVLDVGTNGARLRLTRPLALPDGGSFAVRLHGAGAVVLLAVLLRHTSEDGLTIGVQFRSSSATILRDIDRWRASLGETHEFTLAPRAGGRLHAK